MSRFAKISAEDQDEIWAEAKLRYLTSINTSKLEGDCPQCDASPLRRTYFREGLFHQSWRCGCTIRAEGPTLDLEVVMGCPRSLENLLERRAEELDDEAARAADEALEAYLSRDEELNDDSD